MRGADALKIPIFTKSLQLRAVGGRFFRENGVFLKNGACFTFLGGFFCKSLIVKKLREIIGTAGQKSLFLLWKNIFEI